MTMEEEKTEQLTLSLIQHAMHEASLRSKEPWDFADRCAILMAHVNFHRRYLNERSRGSADFLWSDEWESR